jgi:hypothetical protein
MNTFLALLRRFAVAGEANVDDGLAALFRITASSEEAYP